MENVILDLFEGIVCPVLITDSADIVIYKNSIARKNFTSPRKGSSIKPSIAVNDINIIDDGNLGTSIQTLSNRNTVYRRALVFRVESGRSIFRIWMFDIALQMIRQEMARTFLYNASSALSPLIDRIVETQASGTDVLGDGWTASMHKLSSMLNTALKNLYFTNTHTLCSAEELCKSLHEEVLSKLSALGVSCKSHRIALSHDPVYIDYYSYTLLFIRIFLMIINRNCGNIIDINYTKDFGVFRTEFSFAVKLSDPSTRRGKICDLGSVLEKDTLNIAMIDSLIKSEEGSRAFFEVRRGDMKNLSLIFEMPVKTLPGRRLRQEPKVSDISFAGFMDLAARIISDF